MNNLCVFTIFESDGGKPRCAGTLIGDDIRIFDIFRPGTRRPIATVEEHLKFINNLIVSASRKGTKIVTSDFKNCLKAYNLPIDLRSYNIYDLHYADFKPTDSALKDAEIVRRVLLKMKDTKVKEYQKVYANAAVVYQDLENKGVCNNYVTEKPIWSQKTFSGRSKVTGFTIQNFVEPNYLVASGTNDRSVLLHFDWISADIRVAALLSGDTVLEKAFEKSDPYTFMMEEINSKATTPIDREECKIFLLRSINSMDFTSIAFDIYKQLGVWITDCKKITSEPDGYLETLMRRRFRVAHAKNALAVLNGAQQGSVAHAMQHTIRRVWERLGNRLIMEGHDSLVVSSSKDLTEIKATISLVAEIMLHPFAGLLPDNPVFPLKVSIGRKWRQWKLAAIYRQSGVEYVTKKLPLEDDTKSKADFEED